MTNPGPSLPEVGRSARFAREINILKRCIRELTPVHGLHLRTGVTSNGTFREAFPSSEPGDPGTITRYIVKEVLNDHLRCHKYDGTEDNTDVLIAKPFNLRRTGWHGVAVTYDLSGETYPGSPGGMVVTYTYVSATYRKAVVAAGAATSTEHQVITPHYVADKSIIFAATVDNETGVSVASDLVDVNADGRAWARVL